MDFASLGVTTAGPPSADRPSLAPALLRCQERASDRAKLNRAQEATSRPATVRRTMHGIRWCSTGVQIRRVADADRLLGLVATIVGLRASVAGGGARSSTRSGGATASALPRFRTITGTSGATGFRFAGGRLYR